MSRDNAQLLDMLLACRPPRFRFAYPVMVDIGRDVLMVRMRALEG